MASFGFLEDWKPEYLPTDDKKKVRLIGIEFEGAIKLCSEIPEELQFVSEDYLDSNDIGIEHYDSYDDESDEYYDDEDVQYDQRAKYIEEKLGELGIQVGGVGYDGGGKEFVTYPDSFTMFEEGGSERLKKVLEMLQKATKADKQSGTHINVSKLDSDVSTTYNNLYWFCMCFGPQLQKIFGRITHWARTPLPPDYFTKNNDCNVKMFKAPKKQPVIPSVYNKGFIIIDKGNRYEFRGPKATHELDEVLAWTELCNNIVEVCAKGYIQDVPFSDVLRGEHIRKYVNKIGKDNPERRISPSERAMRISEIGYVQVKEIEKIL